MAESTGMDRCTDLDAALARLEEWVDGTVARRSVHPPDRVVPQLPVPAVGDDGTRAARDILANALMAATTTAVVFACFVVLSMALLPLPDRPSFVP